MKRVLAVAAVLAAAGCRKEPEAGPGATSTVIEWAQQSPDGRFELRQRRDAGSCRVQAVVKPGDRVLWTSQTCLPIPTGLAFLSADGEKLLALDLFPSGPAAQAADWTSVPLAYAWSRGAVVRQYTGGEILSPARAADMHRSLSWVRGDSDDAVHRAARASADGDQVLVDLVDGRTLTFGFDGSALPTPPPAQAEGATARAAAGERPTDGGNLPAAAPGAADPMASDERGLYRWEDDQGQLHFGAGAQVPTRFRKRAQPVSTSVGVLPLEHAMPQVPKAGAEPSAAPQKPPGVPPPAPAPAAGAPAPSAEPLPVPPPAQPQQQPPPAGERPAG